MTLAQPHPWDESPSPFVAKPHAATAFMFVHEGRPVPQGRPRAFNRGGKLVVTKSEASRAYELELANAARAHAVAIGWLPPAADAELMLEAHVYRAADQGDLTNFVKAIEDALTEAGVWLDDRRVVAMVTSMHVDRVRPRVVIAVQRWSAP